MTTGMRSASPTGLMVSDTVRQQISQFLRFMAGELLQQFYLFTSLGPTRIKKNGSGHKGM